MVIEEKYKAAQEWYKIAKEQNNQLAIVILESYFPELAESEDERIRKVLIEYFKDRDSYRDEDETFNGIPFCDIRAWLEKQGEKKPLDNMFSVEQAKILDKHIDNMNKQNPVEPFEIKPNKWYKCIKDYVDRTKGILFEAGSLYKGGINSSIIYEGETEEKVFDKFGVQFPDDANKYFVPIDSIEQKSVEWSEEDVNQIAEIKKQFEQEPIEEVNGEDYGIDGLWAALDILKQTLGTVYGYETDDGILEHKAAITAVKKLYEQRHFKRSEEDEKIAQIKAQIALCNGFNRENRDKIFAMLDSLYS